MDRRNERAALVTGGAQGIGKAICRHLLEAGYRVACADMDREAGMETLEEYEGLGDLAFIEMDVSREDSVRGGVARAVERFGRLDALVNNAGIAHPVNAPVEELPLADWERVIATNLTGVFLVTKHCAPHLRGARGAIVNIASTRALQSEPHTEAYTASKGGVVALTHALAVSLGSEVRVNCISPGWIETGAWRRKSRRTSPELRPEDHAQHPVGRVGRPEDVAALAGYLLSDAAGFVTGQNHVIDGGMTRRMIYEE